MARAYLRSFKAHSYSNATKMIDKKAPSGRVRSSRGSAAQTPTARQMLESATAAGVTNERDSSSSEHELFENKVLTRPLDGAITRVLNQVVSDRYPGQAFA